MIRPAAPADIPRMVELGRVMHGESPTFCRLQFDADKLASTIAGTIASTIASTIAGTSTKTKISA